MLVSLEKNGKLHYYYVFYSSVSESVVWVSVELEVVSTGTYWSGG